MQKILQNISRLIGLMEIKFSNNNIEDFKLFLMIDSRQLC